jgi:thioredoxin 1
MPEATKTEETTLTFIDYYAPWCGPCRAMEPFMPELEKEFEGRVKFEKINVDEQPDISNAAGVMSLPTLHIKKGDKIVRTLIGYTGKEDLAAAFNELLAN